MDELKHLIGSQTQMLQAQTEMFRIYLEKDSTVINEVRFKQEQILVNLARVSDDHEKRIRTLERFLSIAMGAIALASWCFSLFRKI